VLNMSMSERLQQALDARGRNAASVVAELKASKGMVYNILSGKTNPDNVRASTVEAICTALAISPMWLLTGKGPMEPAPVDPTRRTAVREDSPPYLRPITGWDRPDDLPTQGFAFLPHLDAYMSAGNGGPSADAVEATDKATPFRSDYLRRKGWSPSTHYTMRCKGDSMEPTIQDGAPVVIDTSADGTFYADAQDCIDQSLTYWGECASRRAALDDFGACMSEVACSDYSPDAFNPASTPCAQQWDQLGASEPCN
jgi:DNA-binding Xre family transcriptional regulator